MYTMGEFITGLKYYMSSFRHGSLTKSIMACGIAFTTFAIGEIDVAVKAAFMIYVLDFILGVGIAFYNKNFDIGRFRQGLAKMFLFFIVLSGAHQADKIVATMGNRLEGVDYKVIYIKYRVILYFGIHEFISLSKKLISVGFPLPAGLIDKITTYKERLDETDPHSPKYQRDKLSDSI